MGKRLDSPAQRRLTFPSSGHAYGMPLKSTVRRLKGISDATALNTLVDLRLPSSMGR